MPEPRREGAHRAVAVERGATAGRDGRAAYLLQEHGPRPQPGVRRRIVAALSMPSAQSVRRNVTLKATQLCTGPAVVCAGVKIQRFTASSAEESNAG